MRNNKDFDKSFDHRLKGFWATWVIVLAFMLGLVGFIIWVIVQLLRFFGAI